MTTLASSVETYLADLHLYGYTPKTIIGYQKRLNPYLKWATTHQVDTLADFTLASVRLFLSELQKDGKHGPGTIRNYARDLKAFSSWLAREGHTPTSPLQMLRVPRTYIDQPDPFTSEELRAFFTSFDMTNPTQARDRLMFAMLLDTGLRIEELVRLHRTDISLPERTILVKRTKNRGYRRISFGAETAKMLSHIFAAQPAQEHLFSTAQGTPITEHTVQQRCLYYQEKTGIHVHTHRFRHTFAISLLRKHVPLRVVQELLGHADIRMTARYLKLTNDDILKEQQNASPLDQVQQDLNRMKQSKTRKGDTR